MRPPAPASSTSTTASWEFFVGGGVAVLDCDEDGRPDLYFAGGAGAGGPLPRTQRAGRGAPSFEQVSSEATDLDRGHRRLPARHRLRRHRRPGRAAPRRERAPARPRRAAPSSAPTRPGASMAVTTGPRPSAPRGSPGEAWPTLAFGTYIDHVDDAGHHLRAAAAPSCGRLADGGGFGAAASRSSPGYCALSMLFSDWNRSGRRDLRVSNDRHYYREDGEEQLWRIEPGEPPRLYGARGGLAVGAASGAWASPARTSPGTGCPEVYLTNIGSNRLETLAGGAGAADLRGHRPRPGRQRRHDAGRRQARQPVDVLASRVRRRQQRRPHGPLRLQGQRRRHPGQRAEGPQRALPRPARRHASGARPRQAGILDSARTRGAALVDLNADGLLDLVEVHRVRERQRCVATSAAATPTGRRRWATGWPSKLEQAGAEPGCRRAPGSRSRPATAHRRARSPSAAATRAASSGPVHFGLGDRTEARVRVTWPDGEQGEWQDRARRAIVTVERGGQPAERLAQTTP